MSKITNLHTGNEIDTKDLTEIAPNVFVGPIPAAEVPRYGIAKMQQLGDGSYRAVLRTWSGTERLTKNLPERLGVKLSIRVLRALVFSGLVRGYRPSPFITEIDLADLARHRRESGKPGFWTDEKKQAYSQGWNEVLCLGDGEDEVKS